MSGGCKRYSLGALQDWMGTWRTLRWDHVTYLITTKATIGASLWLGGKAFACQCRRLRFNPSSGKIPLAEEEQSLCATTTESVL